jgi:pSer/pThr/pTyr-binding forkhead associated (FHA) protein
MAKLVVLTQSLAGRSHELAAELTTIGRVEDNAFQIAEPSVSSRHCEILLRGSDVLVKDLNSTNGTFINGEKITEKVLKPGQTLRLGNIELKLEVPGAAPAPSAPPSSSAPSTPSAPPPPKKEPAKVTSGGVSLKELESGGARPNFETSTFTKKKAGKALYFWIFVGTVLVIIGIIIIVVVVKARA